MHVLVVGAGAVGSVLGARLATNGQTVTLVGRSDHIRAVTANGLVVEGVGPGTSVLRALTEVPIGGTFDVAILATKTFDLATATAALATRRRPLPTLLVQNGLGVEAVASRAAREAGWPDPDAWLVRAVQSIPAVMVRPGTVRSNGAGEIVLLDPALAGPAASSVRTFLAVFAGGPATIRTTEDLPREIWKKLLVNAAINPVTALHRVPNGALLDPPLRSEALALLEEARAVAEAEGARFASSEAVGEFDRVARATAENRSSMLQDVERGRPTEIEAILGEVVRLGEAHGIATPASRSAAERVRALASASAAKRGT